MNQARRWSAGKLTAGVVLAASLALAACGSDGNPTDATTTVAAAAATTTAPATTTTVAATTTTAFTDSVLKDIAELKDCDTLKTLITITTGELNSAPASNKKLYEARITAAQAQQKTLS